MLGLLAILVLQPMSYALDPADLIWETRPTGEQIGKITPPDTRRLRDLRVDVYCTVGPEHRLRDCFVPKGLEADFRVAAFLKTTKFFKIAPRTRSGLPTAGRTVRVPVRFTLDGE